MYWVVCLAFASLVTDSIPAEVDSCGLFRVRKKIQSVRYIGMGSKAVTLCSAYYVACMLNALPTWKIPRGLPSGIIKESLLTDKPTLNNLTSDW